MLQQKINLVKIILLTIPETRVAQDNEGKTWRDYMNNELVTEMYSLIL